MVRYFIIFGILSAGGLYWLNQNQTPAIQELEKIETPAPPPPPPPEPPPPTLTPKDIEEIRMSLFDSERSVRMTALKKLAAFSGKDADEMLSRQLLIDSDPEIRRHIVRIFKKRGDNAARLIHPALRDTEPAIRIEAIKALGDIRAVEKGPALTRMLFDTEDRVRQEALYTLNRMVERKVIAREQAAHRYTLPPKFAQIYRRALIHAQRRN